MRRVDLSGVPNQFHFEGGRDACIPISIVVIYHLYNRLCANLPLPTREEWIEVVSRGISLYEVWETHLHSELYMTTTTMPTIHEMLQLDECEPFLELFNIARIERSGLARKPTDIAADTNIEGSLYHLLVDSKKLMVTHNKPVCILITLCIDRCVSVTCCACQFYLFDSHGGMNDKDDCECIVFPNAKDLAVYLVQKYEIDNISHVDPAILSLYTEAEINGIYGYNAMIFI